MCCTNGGCFIKVGQHIGTLEYLLPYEYVETMQMLHSKAPQTNIKQIHEMVEKELGQKVCLSLDFENTLVEH